MDFAQPITRRRLIKNAATATASFAAPYFVPSHVLGKPGQPGANDRVIIGVIGTGPRSRQLIDHVPAEGRVVALCDCYKQRYIETLQEKKRSWNTYQYYHDMFEKENLDAVIVGSPDHSRVLICIHACQAGLDVYAEKPLTITIREGRVLVNIIDPGFLAEHPLRVVD